MNRRTDITVTFNEKNFHAAIRAGLVRGIELLDDINNDNTTFLNVGSLQLDGKELKFNVVHIYPVVGQTLNVVLLIQLEEKDKILLIVVEFDDIGTGYNKIERVSVYDYEYGDGDNLVFNQSAGLFDLIG